MKEIKISQGNAKMGHIPSVSLPPVITCREGAPCARKCYACKLCRLRQTVRDAYAQNLEIYREDPAGYFAQLALRFQLSRFFRMHVSGDIPDAEYFARLCDAVERAPGCTVLIFSKRYEIINDYIKARGPLPDNLRVILSNWGAWRCENPHGLPVSEVIFRGEAPRDGWRLCSGNCEECALEGRGCWTLQPGETVAFFEH